MNILVIDDDPSIQWIIQKALGRKHRILEASTLKEARALVKDAHLVFLDIYLPDGSGLLFLEELLELNQPPLVVLVTGKGGPETVIEGMKRGAMDYLPKPFDLKRLRDIVEEAEGLVSPERGEEEAEGFITRSPVMEEVLKLMGRLAAADLPVLITGEKGTGKIATTRYIHAYSSRGKGPFVVFSPGRVPPARIESELFGRNGALEKARGGTLVIRGVEELVPEAQEKLLTALEKGEYPSTNGAFYSLEARIMATTVKDLPKLVVEGSFNEDLFLCLQILTLELPSLRERPEDIPLLIDKFLGQAARELGVKARGFTSQALEAMCRYQWPGNVKELREVVERVVPLARGQPISADLLPLEVKENRGYSPLLTQIREEVRRMLKREEKDIYSKILEQVEKALLEEVLSQTQGNQIRASQILGVHRNTIRRKLSLFGER